MTAARPSLLLAVTALFLCATAAAAPPPDARITIQARVGFDAPQIEGEAELAWRNVGEAPTRTLRVLLYANRFETLDGVNELARHFLLAGPSYRPGGTDLVSVAEDGKPLAWRFQAEPGLPSRVVAAIDLGRELPPGGEARVRIGFRTRLPNLHDTFGAANGLVVADRGWYPLPLAGTSLTPLPAHVRAALTAPAGAHLIVNGRLAAGSEIEVADAGAVFLVLSRDAFESSSVRAGRRTVRLYSAPSQEIESRISPNQSPDNALREALAVILQESRRSDDLTVVRLPLHWYSSANAAGMVLISDRLFEVFTILRPLHQRELAYTLFLDEESRAAAEREPPADASWVAEGLAWRRAEALYRGRFREGREVKDWIRLFDVFAIVDRFETAPRIPFVRSFFPVSVADDPERLRLEGLLEPRPPGRFVFDKIETRLRTPAFEALLARYAAGREPFRDLLRAAGGGEAEAYADAWLRPHVALDYALEDVEANARSRSGVRATIGRHSAAPRPDSIELGVETESGEETTVVDLAGESTALELATASPVRSLTIDPRRRTVETRLDDNRVPGEHQWLLDSADVEVSSTEFGVSTLLIGRRRYDYRKDLALAAFYTSRGYGLDAGFQLHGGKAIDANLYGQNLFAYYALEELDSTFKNKQKPDVRTRGLLGGFGLRFHSYDAFWFVNPGGAHHLRFFFDGYDRALGSDFDFVCGGGSLAYTLPLREDTIVAAEVTNGYSAATGQGPIPNQGLFSLGGFRSIRGIGAEDDLGKDIFLVRAEIRHMLPWRLDWNLQEILIARRMQAKLFVDTGRVGDSSRRLYDPSGFAVGVGGGLNLFYDFMGFFPTTFYLDVATRADRPAGPQILFGFGQPF